MTELFVLIKRGLYWRPDAAGYTGLLREAGTYTKEYYEGRGYPNSEVSVLPYDRAERFSPSCCREVRLRELGGTTTLSKKGTNLAYPETVAELRAGPLIARISKGKADFKLEVVDPRKPGDWSMDSIDSEHEAHMILQVFHAGYKFRL